MQSKRKLLTAGLLALTLVAGGAAVTAATLLKDTTGTAGRAGDFDPVAERMQKAVPSFSLQDQNGEAVTPEGLKGKVVLLTAVYATCHTACPTIITKAKSAVSKLTEAERDGVVIVAITLDPEGDTQDKRAMTAKAHGLDAPLFRYVNGDKPDDVLKLVADLGWARAVAGDSGVIGHSNLFLLVGRDGKIAYAVSADGDNDWLDRSLAVLLAEG